MAFFIFFFDSSISKKAMEFNHSLFLWILKNPALTFWLIRYGWSNLKK